MRIGLFGGTFDPPHVGHLLAASDAFDALALDRLVFIPNARQPLKDLARQASPADRLQMTSLAVGGDDRFAVDGCEVRRGGASYTVDTLETWATAAPGDERYLLVGADAGATFAQWRSPSRIAQLSHIAILCRAGRDAGEDASAALAAVQGVVGAGGTAARAVPTRRVDVSSTEVRRRVREGRAIRGFVTEAVARFIEDRGLYREDGGE